MKNARLVAIFTAVTIAATPSLAVAQSSSAENANNKHTTATPQRAVPKNDKSQQLKYTDQEVAQLLLSGQGRIAEEKPEFLDVLGFSQEKPDADMSKLNLMIDEYLATVPDFHEKVSVPFQSGNPQEMDNALVYLSDTFLKYADARQKTVSADDAAFQGWTWMVPN